MRRALVIVAVLMAGLASGCTGADGSGPAGGAGSGAEAGQAAAMPPADLAGASVRAYQKATSVRMVGTVQTDTTATFDLRVRGRDGRGAVVIGGRTVEIVRVGDALFLKADASFWRQFMPDQATEPWPIRLEGAAVQGRVDFSEYNAPVTITAPSPGEFLDFNTLPEPTGV